MDDNITPIIVKKETVSDDTYTVRDVLFNNGDSVKKGQLVGTFETSKAIVDIDAPENGRIYYNVIVDDIVKVGSIIAAICKNSVQLPTDYFSNFLKAESAISKTSYISHEDGIRASKQVYDLLQKHDININVFKGKSIVRTNDVLEYLKANSQDIKNVTDLEINDYSQNQIVIIGGGGHAKMCIDIIRQMKSFKISGIVDSILEPGTTTLGIPVLGHENLLDELFTKGIRNAVIGIGALHAPQVRADIFNKLKKIGYILPNIIHPSAIIEPSAILGEGNQVMAGAIIGSDVKVNSNCIINSGSVVSHDCVLSDNVHVTPGALLAGSVEVGNNSIIGMGSTVLLKVRIGENVIITNGVNVVKNVSDGSVLKHSY